MRSVEVAPAQNEPGGLTVHLHFDTGGRPVGTVRCEEGDESGFVGWLALMAECSRLLAGQPESPELL